MEVYMNNYFDYLIVGSGLFGSIFAYEAKLLNEVKNV